MFSAQKLRILICTALIVWQTSIPSTFANPDDSNYMNSLQHNIGYKTASIVGAVCLGVAAFGLYAMTQHRSTLDFNADTYPSEPKTSIVKIDNLACRRVTLEYGKIGFLGQWKGKTRKREICSGESSEIELPYGTKYACHFQRHLKFKENEINVSQFSTRESDRHVISVAAHGANVLLEVQTSNIVFEQLNEAFSEESQELFKKVLIRSDSVVSKTFTQLVKEAPSHEWKKLLSIIQHLLDPTEKVLEINKTYQISLPPTYRTPIQQALAQLCLDQISKYGPIWFEKLIEEYPTIASILSSYQVYSLTSEALSNLSPISINFIKAHWGSRLFIIGPSAYPFMYSNYFHKKSSLYSISYFKTADLGVFETQQCIQIYIMDYGERAIKSVVL